MSKRYEVTHVPHYIGGRLVYPGQGEDSIVTLPKGVEPGRWLVEVGKAPKREEPKSNTQEPLYRVDHISRGDYHVVRVSDEERSSVVFSNTGKQGEAKELAEAEAERLNNGGVPKLEVPESSDTDSGLPDA